MSDLPSLIFSTEAKLKSERLVFLNMPQFNSLSELESAFFSSITKNELKCFIEYCSRSLSDIKPDMDFKIYRLINFFPYRFAFCEKCFIDNTTLNILFLSENIVDFHSLMLPTHYNFRDTTSRLVYELLCIKKHRFNDSFTPEAFIVFNHLPDYAASLSDAKRASVYCDLDKLVRGICQSFTENNCYSDIKFEYKQVIRKRPCIVELPPIPFVYILISVFLILYGLSDDRTIFLEVCNFAYAGELTVSVTTSLLEKIPSECGSLSDVVKNFPSFHTLASFATLISYISDLIISPVSDSVSKQLKIIIGVGFDYQSEPDFKYSDPYSNVEKLTKQALDLFGIL